MENSEKPSILFVALNRHQRQYFRQLGTALNTLYNVHHIYYGLSDFSGALIQPELPEVVDFTEQELADIIRFLLIKGKSRKFTGIRAWLHSQAVLKSRAYFATRYFYHYICHHPVDLVGVWNGINLPLACAARVATKLEKKTLFFENGYLHNTTTVDPKGVNYQNSLVNKPRAFYDAVILEEEFLAAIYNAVPAIRGLKAKWYQSLLSTPPSNPPEDIILPDKFIFLPFQVQDDTQVLLYSPRIQTMGAFVECVVRGVKQYNLNYQDDMWIVIKEHPSDFGRVDYSALKEEYKNDKIIFLRYYSTPELIASSQGIITLNSTVGIEALLQHKPVITLGNSFYNIDGLVRCVTQVDQLADEIPFVFAEPDHQLIDKFLYYLRYQYLAEGSWRQPDAMHFESVAQKIRKLL